LISPFGGFRGLRVGVLICLFKKEGMQ